MTSADRRLFGVAAAAAVLTGFAGFGLARCTPAKSGGGQQAAAPPAAKDSLTMSPEALKVSAIAVEPASAGNLSDEILAQATAAAAPSGQAVLTARAAGAVTRIFKRLGDPVRAGEVVAVVESGEAAQIAADRAAAAAKARLADETLAREKSLYEQRVSPRVDYEQAQAEAAAAAAEARRARAVAGAARVTADGRGVEVSSPIAGRVTAASASLGAFVQPETELFRIADPRQVQIEATISGIDAPRVTPGDRAVVETPDGHTLEGRVRSVTPTLNAETRAATAVLDVPAAGLQPGQALRARLYAKGGAGGGVVVPEEAVQSVDGHDAVFVRTPNGFKVQPVTVGQRSAGRAQIVAGLGSGQPIATRNAFLLKAELSKGQAGDED